MATNFSPCKGSYVLNQFPSNVLFGMNGFHVSASGAIQGHHGPLVFLNFEGFDPKVFLNDPQNLLFTIFISYEGGHCDTLNKKLRENPQASYKYE